MREHINDYFCDVALLIIRTPHLITLPDEIKPEVNEIGEPVYDERQIPISGRVVAKDEQIWNESNIQKNVSVIFITDYYEEIPAGSVIQIGDKRYHKFTVQRFKDIFQEALVKILLEE